MQYIALMGLDKLGTSESQKIALDWTARYIRSNYLGWNNKKQMYEKYSALASGIYGDGGEYDVQIGFGWSNGVALHFLNKYYDQISATNDVMLKSCSTGTSN